MSIEENKALGRRFYEEVFSQGNVAIIDEICDVNWAYYDPLGAHAFYRDHRGEWPRGPQGARQLVNLYRTAFYDLQFTIEDELAEEETVVLRWTARGSFEYDFMGMRPTGRLATIAGITIMHFVSGKIAENWVNFDACGMFQQLGYLPPFSM